MRFVFLLVLASCMSEPGDPLQERRIALGLSDEPLPIAAAMKEIDKRGMEQKLAAGRMELDDALRLENLLRRAHNDEMAGPLAEARRLAAAFLRDRDVAATDALVDSCLSCHRCFRKRR